MCAVYSLGLWKGHCHARGTFLLSLIMKVVQSGTAAWPGLVSSASEQQLPGADNTTTQQHWDINTTSQQHNNKPHNTTMDTRSKGSPARMVSAGDLVIVVKCCTDIRSAVRRNDIPESCLLLRNWNNEQCNAI